MQLKRFIAAVAVGLSSIGVAQAAQTWAWLYTGPGVLANGTFVTAGPALTFEPILSVTGSRNGVPISGLVPLDEDPVFSYDNQFSAVGDHFTLDGVLFDFAGSLPNVNLYVDGGAYLDIDGGTGVETEVVFRVSAVPEPAAALTMLAGLAVLAMRRRPAAAAGRA